MVGAHAGISQILGYSAMLLAHRPRTMVAILAGACALLMGTDMSFADDASEGSRHYEKECGYCHFSAELPLESRGGGEARLIPAMMATFGPKLRGIVGRAAGSDSKFNYSADFRAGTEGLIWTRDNLDRFMTNSRARGPGTRMFYRHPDARIRRQIIAYLKTTG